MICAEKKNYSLKDNIQQMKKLMVGVGCPELLEAENDDVGGLQSLFDVEQAKNIATHVHEGSAAFVVSIQFLPARRYASAVFATATCLSVCPSVCHMPVLCLAEDREMYTF